MKILNKNILENVSEINDDSKNLVYASYDVFDKTLQRNVSRHGIIDKNNNSTNDESDIYQYKKFSKEVMLKHLLKRNDIMKGELDIANAEITLIKKKLNSLLTRI